MIVGVPLPGSCGCREDPKSKPADRGSSIDEVRYFAAMHRRRAARPKSGASGDVAARRTAACVEFVRRVLSIVSATAAVMASLESLRGRRRRDRRNDALGARQVLSLIERDAQSRLNRLQTLVEPAMLDSTDVERTIVADDRQGHIRISPVDRQCTGGAAEIGRQADGPRRGERSAIDGPAVELGLLAILSDASDPGSRDGEDIDVEAVDGRSFTIDGEFPVVEFHRRGALRPIFGQFVGDHRPPFAIVCLAARSGRGARRRSSAGGRRRCDRRIGHIRARREFRPSDWSGSPSPRSVIVGPGQSVAGRPPACGGARHRLSAPPAQA